MKFDDVEFVAHICKKSLLWIGLTENSLCLLQKEVTMTVMMHSLCVRSRYLEAHIFHSIKKFVLGTFAILQSKALGHFGKS
jgi:hypothetical protein